MQYLHCVDAAIHISIFIYLGHCQLYFCIFSECITFAHVEIGLDDAKQSIFESNFSRLTDFLTASSLHIKRSCSKIGKWLQILLTVLVTNARAEVLLCNLFLGEHNLSTAVFQARAGFL